MNKMSVRDRFILFVLALCIVSYFGYTCMWLPVSAELMQLTGQEANLKAQIGDQTPLDKRITELENRNKELQTGLAQYKAVQGKKTLNKEDFLVYLSRQCNDNKTELIKFIDLGTYEENDIWQVQMDFELRGTLTSLNRVCKSIQDLGIRYSVGGLTLRQDEESEYLKRYFDSISKLEWYQYEKPEKEEKNEATAPPPTASPNTAPKFQIPQFTPEPAPVPIPSPPPTPASPPPAKTPQTTPQPSQEPEESITDRLDKLLEQTSEAGSRFQLVNLTNASEQAATGSNHVMRLDITVQFTVYHDPLDYSHSFLYQQEDGNGVL